MQLPFLHRRMDDPHLSLELWTSRPHNSRGTVWLAQSVIILVFLALTCATWAHWGNVRIDCGRELYVPANILEGKMLYRDLWYLYGPLAPYLKALLLFLFGVHLNVLYGLGLAITLTFALLLFALSRRFLPASAALLISFLFLLQGFHPTLFNYVFPYSYAATLGSLLGLACLYFLVRDIFSEPGPNFMLAGLTAGLALLCKQEYGLACYFVLAFALICRTWSQRSLKWSAQKGIALLPGLLICTTGYGWFIWKTSARFILMENFQQIPGSFFMRTFGSKWLADTGLSFHWHTLLLTQASALFFVIIWSLLAKALRSFLILFWLFFSLGAIFILAWFFEFTWTDVASIPLFLEMVFPRGMAWLVLLLLVWTLTEFFRGQSKENNLALAAVAFFALTAGARILFRVSYAGYAIFYNTFIFLPTLIFLWRIIQRLLKDLPSKQRDRIFNGILLLEGLALFLLLIPHPSQLPARLYTPVGTIFTYRSEADLFPKIVSFIQEQKKLGKRVLILPEETLLYTLSGTEAPTRWYQLTPGILDPQQEEEYIQQTDRHGIDFILLSNRSSGEYGVPFFGLDYNHKVYRWIEQNYEVVGEEGHFVRRPMVSFSMLIYGKRAKPATPEQILPPPSPNHDAKGPR